MLLVQCGGHRAATQSFTELPGESCGATNECLKEMARPGLCQWKSCPLADHGDLSTGVSVGRALMASLAWQPHFSVALLLATSTLGQLLIALMVYLDCCVYGSKASLVTEGARRV